MSRLSHSHVAPTGLGAIVVDLRCYKHVAPLGLLCPRWIDAAQREKRAMRRRHPESVASRSAARQPRASSRSLALRRIRSADWFAIRRKSIIALIEGLRDQ
jgi:hypothetical protein